MGTWRSFFSFCPVTARLLVRRGGVGGALAAFGSSSFFWRVWVCVCVWGEGGPSFGLHRSARTHPPCPGGERGHGWRAPTRAADGRRTCVFFFFSSFARRGRGGGGVGGTLFFFFFGFPTKRDCGVFPVLAQKGSSGVLTRNARGFFFRFFFLWEICFGQAGYLKMADEKGEKKKKDESRSMGLCVPCCWVFERQAKLVEPLRPQTPQQRAEFDGVQV